MDIRASLQKEHSIRMTKEIVNYIGHDVDRFEELLNIFLNPDEDTRIVQRSAWSLSYAAEKNKNLLLPIHLNFLIN